MLFSLLSISQIISNSWACEDILTVQKVFPASGSLEVAQDVVLRLTMDGGLLDEAPQFVLTSGEEQIAIEVSIATRPSSDRTEFAYIEITPVELLPAKHQFTLSMVEHSEENEILSDLSVFQTRLGMSEIAEDAPILYYFSKYESWVYEECDLLRDEIYFDLDPVEGQSINIYTVGIDVISSGNMDELDLQTPFFTVFPDASYDDLYAYIPVQEYGLEMCFVTAYASESGIEGPLSSIQCLSDVDYSDFKCGTGAFWGCSSTAPETFGWMGMILAMLGFKRRRETVK